MIRWSDLYFQSEMITKLIFAGIAVVGIIILLLSELVKAISRRRHRSQLTRYNKEDKDAK